MASSGSCCEQPLWTLQTTLSSVVSSLATLTLMRWCGTATAGPQMPSGCRCRYAHVHHDVQVHLQTAHWCAAWHETCCMLQLVLYRLDHHANDMEAVVVLHRSAFATRACLCCVLTSSLPHEHACDVCSPPLCPWCRRVVHHSLSTAMCGTVPQCLLTGHRRTSSPAQTSPARQAAAPCHQTTSPGGHAALQAGCMRGICCTLSATSGPACDAKRWLLHDAWQSAAGAW